MPDTPIGTNSPDYTLVTGDLAASIYCKVTATNASGTANANSNTVGPVAAAPSSGYTLVGSVSGLAAATVTSSTVDTTGANLLIVCGGCYPVPAVPTISDNKGNTWNTIEYGSASSSCAVALYWSKPTTVGTGHTITLTGDSFFGSFTFAAFSGALAAPFDDVDGDSGVGAAATAAAPITPALNNSLVIAAVAFDGGSTAPIDDVSFTVIHTEAFSAGVNLGHAMAYLVQPTAAAVNPTWTITSGAWGAVVASFKPA